MKVQRKIVVKSSEELSEAGAFSLDGKKIFRLKNILPTGKIAFTDDSGKVYLIDAMNEFDITESELDLLEDCRGFDEGFLIYTKVYPEHDSFCNCMSDEKINQLIKLPLRKFENIVKTLDSAYIFDRVKKALVENHKPSGYLQFVTLRESELKDEFIKSQRYETDSERNKRLYGNIVSR